MRRIGLIGGMSWQSSAEYYRLINQEVARRLGGRHSADLVLCSVDFEPIAELQHTGDWSGAGAVLVDAAARLEAAGIEALVLCTNTMHRVADVIEAAVCVPLLHICDETARAVTRASVETIGLLGTRFTMEADFYRQRLEAHGLSVLTPRTEDRRRVHSIIYEELCQGVIRESSRAEYRDVIDRLVERGAEGVILGCTEIGLLIQSSYAPVPLFDTTRIHALAATDFALGLAGAG